MDGTAFIGWIAQAIPACLLLFAGLAKLRRPETLAQVFTRLGAPSRTASQVAWLVIAAELTFGTALLVAAGAVWPRVGAALLAIGFALAGLRAMTAKLHVRCACFGDGQATLGKRQLLALPGWLIALAVAQLVDVNGNVQGGLGVLAGALTVGFAVRLLRNLAFLRDVRADRVALT
ncbi:hypothetical protein GCM10009804_47990 [Kribbella hippodromi]|uniref:Methylamine utilisation protein MauE domain-containing protein n=1 Tax=Kribbella hippodromi TaxID=434347 RepID=A0ABN2DTQ2_9ACTN